MKDERSESASNLLLLLTTERQGFAFNLARRSRVTIGRHDSNDLQLDSRTVSNFHAEIVCEPSGLTLRDLGSTNGTHVSDRRVEVEGIAKGDGIRIGNHLITVDVKTEDDAVTHQERVQLLGARSQGRIISLRGGSAAALRTATGRDLHDFTFPDLLKRVVNNPKSLGIVAKRGGEVARVWSRNRGIVHAEYGKVVGEKALYRVFAWAGGEYEIEEPDPNDPLTWTISLPVNTLVVEGMAHAIELGKLVARLPPLEAHLRLKEDCPLPVTAHSPAEIEVFQLIIRHETLASTMESSALPDVKVLRLIEALLEKGVFEAVESFDDELAGTLLLGSPGKTV